MTHPVSQIQVPILNWQIEISVQDKKILAVAIASLLFFGVQFGLSLPVTFAITFLLTGLTYLCERNRIETEDWFNTSFDKKQLGLLAAFLILKPLILQIIFWGLGIPLPAIPQIEIAQAILSQPWKMIPLATVIAPFAEEILFRGVLLERLQDAAGFLSRHVVDLSQNSQQHLSHAIQAIIFGALHLRRTIEEGMHIPLVLSLSLCGYLLGLLKCEDNSLISPIAVHSANNIGAVIYIFQSNK